MRSFSIIFFFFFTTAVLSQQNKYSYYLYLNNYQNAPKFENSDTGASYVGDTEKLKKFFSNYEVLKFYQAFPEYLGSEEILSVYFVETTSSTLISDISNQLPGLAHKFDDLTNTKVETLYYPNDYGITSQQPNLGANASRKDLDYLHAPEAWEITKGNPEIILGISDTYIDITSLDLNDGKVQFISGYNGATTSISHGTGVAELAVGRGNNAHGSAGVCMDCRILASRIGYDTSVELTFGKLYKLANEGARVINMSWTSSGYVNNLDDGYRQVEQDLINYLVTNFNVVFVASAGNRSSFSSPEAYDSERDQNGIPTGVPFTPFGILYVYPASYDNVICVSSINHKNPILDSSSYCCTSPWFPVYLNIEDSVGNCVSGEDLNNPIGVTHNGFYVNQYKSYRMRCGAYPE